MTNFMEDSSINPFDDLNKIVEGYGDKKSKVEKDLSNQTEYKSTVVEDREEPSELINPLQAYSFENIMRAKEQQTASNQYAVISTLANYEFLPTKGGNKQVIDYNKNLLTNEYHKRFTRANEASSVDKTPFLDVVFEDIDWSKVSQLEQIRSYQKALNLQQMANGVTDPEEIGRIVNNKIYDMFGGEVADIVANKAQYIEPTMLKALQEWLVKPVSDTSFKQYVDDYSKEVEQEYVYKGDFLKVQKLTEEQIKNLDLQVALTLAPLTFGTSTILAGVAGAYDIATGGFALATGKEPIQSIFLPEEKVDRLGWFSRAMYGLGGAAQAKVSAKALSEIATSTKNILTGTFGEKAATEFINGGKQSVAAGLKLSFDSDAEKIPEIMRLAYSSEPINATDQELVSIAKAIVEGNLGSVDDVLARTSTHPISSLAKTVAKSEDPLAHKYLNRAIFDALSRDETGKLTKQAQLAVKALGEDTPYLADMIASDVRSLKDWPKGINGTDDPVYGLLTGMYRRNPKEYIPALEEFDDVLSLPAPAERLQIEWRGDVIELPHTATPISNKIIALSETSKSLLPKSFKEVGLHPAFKEGARIRLQSGQDVIVTRVDGDKRLLFFRDSSGVEHSVEWNAKQQLITKQEMEKRARQLAKKELRKIKKEKEDIALFEKLMNEMGIERMTK